MKHILTLAIFLITTLAYTQSKTVHLAHGLDKSDNSWGSFSDRLKARCDGVETTTYQMSLTNGLDAYSNQFISNLQQYGATNKDIAIGHSFGGANLRNIDGQNLGLFGGYITVGSPHHGSKLANSTLNGDLEAWVTLGCKDGIADPVAAALDVVGFEPPSAFLDDGDFFLCDLTFGILMEQAEEFVGSGLGVEEMVLGGPLAQLPPSSIPSISIKGYTDHHVLWNLLQGAVTSNYPNSINGKPFTAFAQFLQNNALGTSKFLTTISALNRFNLFSWDYHQKIKKASREFLEAYTWMRNSESVWNELIGAGGGVTWLYEDTEVWACHCYNINTGQPVPCATLGSSIEVVIMDVDPLSTCAADDDEDCWIIESIATPVFGEDLPSDGLLTVDGQSLPGSLYEERVNNVSHFEQPFDVGLQAILLKHLHPSTSIHPVFEIQECL